MEKVKKMIIVFIVVFLVIGFSLNSYAAGVPVTKQNLNESLQKLLKLPEIEGISKIVVEDKNIMITMDGKELILSYDLTGKPTFTYEFQVKEGMSYDVFKEEIEKLSFPLSGYAGVANVQGADIGNALEYASMIVLKNELKDLNSNSVSYMIVDDTNLKDGVKTDNSDSNINTIYVSEFGSRVMEYVNDVYKDKDIISDKTEGIDSFEMIIEKKETTPTSCKLSSTVTVNTDADFSKINEYENTTFLDKEITKENADYVVDLNVGQKCRFESEEKIKGHEIQGADFKCEKINENCLEITGNRKGVSNGYIYLESERKSFYITTTDNEQDKNLTTKVIKIKAEENFSNNNSSNSNNLNNIVSNNNYQKTSNTTVKQLPRTGIKNIIYILIAIIVIAIIIFFEKYKKVKDI